MATVSVEQIPDRPAWEVRVDGQRVGIVWREGRTFRAIREGEETPLSNKFNSREAAARGLARRAGFDEIGTTVVDTDARRDQRKR